MKIRQKKSATVTAKAAENRIKYVQFIVDSAWLIAIKCVT